MSNVMRLFQRIVAYLTISADRVKDGPLILSDTKIEESSISHFSILYTHTPIHTCICNDEYRKNSYLAYQTHLQGIYEGR